MMGEGQKVVDELPKVCIVVPTYFAGEVLRKVLKSIAGLAYPHDRIEVIIVAVPVDEDASLYVKEFEKTYSSRIKFITANTDNVDVLRNYGIKLCDHNYVSVVDDDIILDKSILNRSLDNMLSHEKVAAVAYPVMSDNPSFSERLHHGRFLSIIATAYTVMPCTFFEKDALMRAGLYREDMGPPNTIHEDWELGSRLRKYGYTIIVDGTIVQRHLGAVRKRISKTESCNSPHIGIVTRVKQGIAALRSYANSYLRSNYETFFEVMKSSPLLQQVEYAIYFLMPLIGLGLLPNPLYALVYVIFLVSLVDAHSFIKGYYKVFGPRERLVYPILLTSVRVVRTYLSVLGLLIKKVNNVFR